MSTYIGNPATKLDKVFYAVLGSVMVSFIISMPFMIADKQARLDREWKDKGCQMYDVDRIADLPSKCNNDFTDHYKSKQLREQP